MMMNVFFSSTQSSPTTRGEESLARLLELLAITNYQSLFMPMNKEKDLTGTRVPEFKIKESLQRCEVVKNVEYKHDREQFSS